MKTKLKFLSSFLVCFLLLHYSALTYGQSTVADSVDTQIHFKGDFRFRVEHDWKSRKSDGTYRNDRSRLRYRFRFGLTKNLNSSYSIGARIRTGNINDQQGPHLTIGGGNGEFGLSQIGFEKIYFRFENKHWWAWIGKNDYPFFKQNELLWNDNVFPEGAAVGWKLKAQNNWQIQPVVGHFIFKSHQQTFDLDAYLFSAQIKSVWTINPQHRLMANVGNLYFNNMPDIPDGQSTYHMNYHLFNTSFCYEFTGFRQKISAGFDLFYNTTDYTQEGKMEEAYLNEKTGWVLNVKLGQLKKQSDFTLEFYYASIDKYAIVDFLAQNDWARWDYSGNNASGSRLSNFSGYEIRAGYQLTHFFNLILRYYQIQEKVTPQTFKENGQRIRLDLNVRF
ncbi:MAG: putative porin [Bacteroidota bacterium]